MLQEKHFVTQKGTICYWVNELQHERQTVVFLPGLTADHHLFDAQLEFFEQKYNVFVWDAPAHAASVPFELSFSLDDKARWLHEILAAGNISRPIIVGQSMGGYVAQCFMELFPKSLSGFISIDSAPLKRKYVTVVEIWLLRRMEPVYRWYPWKLLIRTGSKGCATTEYGQSLMRQMMNTYSHKQYAVLSGFGFRLLAEAFAADRAYEIDCPCLLICGENDKAGSTKRYNRAWASQEKLPILWVPNAGHNSNTDSPDVVNRAIDDFVKKVSK